MPIQAMPKDTFYTTVNDTFPYNVFLYFLDDTLMGKNYENSMPIANSGGIISVQYAPFINKDELLLYEIPYDKERYKYKDDGSQVPINAQPKVYRISRFNIVNANTPGVLNKRLGTFKAYNPKKNIGGARSWVNESKLYNFPYRYAYISDGMSEPFEIKYENCKENTNELWVRMALNINADYSFYIRNYKEDYDGLLEQKVASSSRDLPCSSNQYSQWLSQNKNQMNNNSIMSALNSAVSMGSVGAGVGATFAGVGALPGAIIGAGVGLATGGFKSVFSQNAQENDMRNTPNTIVSRGADFILGMNTHQKQVKLIRYTQKEEYLNKIGDFFAMYGYKQNKIMKPNTRNRHYYNFMKTNGVNIKSNGIPKNHLETIKSIYDNGVTLWHIDRPGVTYGDYSKDNKEY